tara:strand:- start:6674 stop:7201 length:528 start_codon:yes stop_codon:yes gene_type:complete
MAKEKTTKVKKHTTKIGSGESRSVSQAGEFSVRKVQTRGLTDEKKTVRTEFEIVGTTGHVSKFRTGVECLNFIQLVFKRSCDSVAFKADKLEFTDDGQLSRSEKSKLITVGNQLTKVIETMDAIKRICLTGDIGSGTLNANVFRIVDDSNTSIDTKIKAITEMMEKGRESECWIA